MAPGARVTIAGPALLGLGSYGERPRLARCSQGSRRCVYTLRWQGLALDPVTGGAPWAAPATRHAGDRESLLRRLAGQGSLEARSPLLKPWGRPCSALGAMAQRLVTDARALPPAAPSGTPSVLGLCDARGPRGQPRLSPVEPRALARLTSERGDHRAAETWQQPGAAWADAGWIAPPR